MDNKIKNVTSGIKMGMINMVINMILPFVIRTIIIFTLGTTYVGLNGLFASILSVLSLSELGIGTSIASSLYKPIAENNVDKVSSILNLYKKIYKIIGVIIIVLSVALLPFLDIFVEGDVPQNINLQILFIIYVINTVISYLLFGYKKVLFVANQRYDIEVSIASLTFLMQEVAQIIVLLIFKNYYAYVLVFPIATALNNFISNFVINRKYPQYRYCKGTISKNELVTLVKKVSGAFCAKIGSTVYLSVDSIVVSAFLGLTILGLYSNYQFIITSLISIFAVIHNSLRPVLGNCVATKSVGENWDYMKLIDRIYMMFVTICCSCCMILYQDFEMLWAGKENMLSNSMVLLFVLYFYTGRMSCVLTVYQEAAGIWWHGKFIPIISAVLNLILNIVGVYFIGLPAILLSSIVTSVLITLPGEIWIMFRYYFKEKRWLKEYIISLFVVMIQAVIIIFLSYNLLNSFIVKDWFMFLVKGGLSVGISIVLMILLNMRSSVLKNLFKHMKLNHK